jgi:DNA-binding winged helix-turn-helix (wHTH) protein
MKTVIPFGLATIVDTKAPLMPDATRSKILCFGAFQLDLAAGKFYGESGRIPLQEQPFKLLKMLANQPGQVITREEIRGKLWPNGTIVEFDHRINTAVKKLRQALGDQAWEPHYIETVGRRGYRLMAPVQRAERLRAGPVAEAESRCDFLVCENAATLLARPP